MACASTHRQHQSRFYQQVQSTIYITSSEQKSRSPSTATPHTRWLLTVDCLPVVPSRLLGQCFPELVKLTPFPLNFPPVFSWPSFTFLLCDHKFLPCSLFYAACAFSNSNLALLHWDSLLTREFSAAWVNTISYLDGRPALSLTRSFTSS